ncbi:MAG: hypothetical protein AAFU85_07125, partial [Planctomycetota bacterium]
MEGQYKSEERLRALSDHPALPGCETVIETFPQHTWDATVAPIWRQSDAIPNGPEVLEETINEEVQR